MSSPKDKERKIQVITKIPNPDKENGNLCDEILIKKYDKGDKEYYFYPFNDHKLMKKGNFIAVKQEVFQLGEIIVVDENEREIGGIARKASKWFVDYKLFKLNEIEKAIRLSKKVTKSHAQ